MTAENQILIDGFTRHLETALAAMPVEQRTEIVSSLRSHLADRAHQGDEQLKLALERLGDPFDYARPFLEDFELGAALNRSSPASLLSSILGRGTRSIPALALGAIGALLYSVTLSFAAVAVLKPLIPRNVGFWLTDATVQFGVIGTPPIAGDLLGYWIVPISLAGAIICYLAARVVLKRGGRLLLRRGSQMTGAVDD